jgi:hypothetical protein
MSKYSAISVGTLVLKVTDKINLTEVSAVNLVISKVEVHKAVEGETLTETGEVIETNETDLTGWETVVNESKSFNLIEIRGVEEFLGERTLLTGRYTQIRLEITDGDIIINGTTYKLIIPSKKFKLVRSFTIEPNKTTTLVFDFDVGESIVKTGVPPRPLLPPKPQYILKPVIKLIIR